MIKFGWKWPERPAKNMPMPVLSKAGSSKRHPVQRHIPSTPDYGSAPPPPPGGRVARHLFTTLGSVGSQRWSITPYIEWINLWQITLLPQDATRWGTSVSLYGVIGYHVTLWDGHMIANHPHIWGDLLSCDSLRGSHDSQSPHIRT